MSYNKRKCIGNCIALCKRAPIGFLKLHVPYHASENYPGSSHCSVGMLRALGGYVRITHHCAEKARV